MKQGIKTDTRLTPDAAGVDAGWLEVGDGHALYYEQYGDPAGVPVLFLHGGPGSGCTPRQRRWFDPAQQRVVFVDQRGCGRSKPRGSVRCNTSTDLIADFERLRRHLGLQRWLLAGGSWGAGLALAYACAHPAACAGLLLRAVFLGRPEDIHAFFDLPRRRFEASWRALAQAVGVASARDLPTALARGLNAQDQPRARRMALAWEAWEMSVARQVETLPREGVSAAEADALVDKYRIQGHYLANGCFWGDAPLLARAAALRGVPALILHGLDDQVCRPEGAAALHRQLSGSRLQWLAGCGHDPYVPAMDDAFRRAVAHHAMHGDFEGWGGDEEVQR